MVLIGLQLEQLKLKKINEIHMIIVHKLSKMLKKYYK